MHGCTTTNSSMDSIHPEVHLRHPSSGEADKQPERSWYLDEASFFWHVLIELVKFLNNRLPDLNPTPAKTPRLYT